MWQRQIDTSIMPLVSESSTSNKASLNNIISRAFLTEEWDIYANSTNTAKDEHDDFIVKKELIKFLLPYKDIINVPTNATHFRMFFSFFIKISPENSIEINELHLSKVIALLQLFTDVNLPASDRAPHINMLENIFSDRRMGRDVLNLLFSYGLRYEKFSFYLDITRKENIDPKILELADNNNYIKVYETLRDAYTTYQNKDYEAAKELYKTARQLLNTLKKQKGLSPIILKDYDERDRSAQKYYHICCKLEEKKKTQQADISAGWLCRSYSRKPSAYEDSWSPSEELLKTKKK